MTRTGCSKLTQTSASYGLLLAWNHAVPSTVNWQNMPLSMVVFHQNSRNDAPIISATNIYDKKRKLDRCTGYWWCSFEDRSALLDGIYEYYYQMISSDRQVICFWLDNAVTILCLKYDSPDSKVHGANMGPTWVLSVPDGPHVGPMNLAIRESFVLRFQPSASNRSEKF